MVNLLEEQCQNTQSLASLIMDQFRITMQVAIVCLSCFEQEGQIVILFVMVIIQIGRLVLAIQQQPLALVSRIGLVARAAPATVLLATHRKVTLWLLAVLVNQKDYRHLMLVSRQVFRKAHHWAVLIPELGSQKAMVFPLEQVKD